MPVRVRVGKLPLARVILRKPTTSSGARVVVSGVKTSTVRTLNALVKAAPVVRVAPSRSRVDVGRNVRAALSVSGSLGGSRVARVTLYGPFTSRPAATTCTAADRVASATVKVTGNGTFRSTPFAVERAGYYAWNATLPGSRLNQPATTRCTGVLTGLRSPTVKATAQRNIVAASGKARSLLRVSGLPIGYDDNVEATVYGPYPDLASAGCGKARAVRSVDIRVTGNDRYTSAAVRLKRAGIYSWLIRVPASRFSHAATSTCGTADASFRVREQ